MALLAIFDTGTLPAQKKSANLPTIRTTHLAHHLTIAEASRAYPVRLRAVVTYYDTDKSQHRPTLFVSDRTGSIYVLLETFPDHPYQVGDLVEVDGVSGPGNYAPIVAHARAKVVGRGPMPTHAPRLDIGDVLSGEWNCEWIEVEAVVHAVRLAPETVTLSLSMKGGIIAARAVREPGVDYNQLIDSKVLLRGNAAPSFNHQGQITGGKILFPGIQGVKIEQPATENPFDLPIQHADNLLRYTPKFDLPRRAHLRGAVTLYWPGRLLCIEDGAEGICAGTDQSTPLQTGDFADVIGFPVMGEFTPTLLNTTYQQSEGKSVVAVQTISPEQALEGRYDEHLVSIEGKVIGNLLDASDPTALLVSGSTTFYAVLPKQRAGSVFNSLAPGSRVKLTGICSVQSDIAADPSNSSFPVAKSFRILLRSPKDLVIVERPSWWNAAHTLRVLAFALVLTLFALFLVARLSRRVRQQSEVIRGQLLQTAALKDAAESATIAAEFHAAHDELTGTRNRRTIFAAFQKAFAEATKLGHTLGVIMVDLDHFKQVNDTYGHLTGDEVLRETVRRITLAVRSSDLVGRYGGEEFMVVLPQCDKIQLRACAERIRIAIASHPMIVGELAIAMTTSVGTAITMSPPHAMLDALAAADSALYQAKNGGRNRVVLKDLATGQFEESLIIAA